MNKTILNRVAAFTRVLHEIPEIRYIGDPILRCKAERVELNEAKLIGSKLGDVLLRYRKMSGFGRGLAAPQIGINKAVFVTYVDEKLQIFVNPEIVEKSSVTNLYKEICLSSALMAAEVQRPTWIVMKWTDLEGVVHKEKIEGFLARLYQHEEAHLRGVVCLDEATPQGIELALFDPLKEELRDK